MANIIEIILKAIDQTGTGTSGAIGNMQKLGQTATKIGTGLTIGLTAPLVGAGLASIDMASDMEESLSKVGVVFGDSAGDIAEWAEGAATAFGMSQQQALEAAGTYGNLFTAMGVTGDASSEMSQGLVQLAADLASFNNIDPTVALDKLRAGISGESEPLKSLGVLLTQAAVEAKALELGLAASTDELTQADLATARYALIMEQTALAQGDFARTSDGLANSTRIMKAQLADASATLGQALLPIALQVVTALTGLVEKFNNLSPAGQKVVVVVGAILAAIGPLLLIVGQVITIFSTLAGLFGAGGALAGIGSAFAAIAAPVLGVLAAIASFLLPPILAFNTLKNIIEKVKEAFPGLETAWTNLWENIKTAATNAGTALREKFDELLQSIKDKFAEIDWNAIGTAIIDGIKAGVSAAAKSLVDAVVGAAQAALDAVKDLLNIDSPSKVFAGIGANIMEGMAMGISGSAGLPVGAISGATAAVVGGSGVVINQNNSVSSDIDIERMAYRVAEVMHRQRSRV